MKNFNIFRVHRKIGLGQFADLRGAWQERGGGVFKRGVDTSMQTMRNV